LLLAVSDLAYYSHADGLRSFCRWIEKNPAGNYLSTKNLFHLAVANRLWDIEDIVALLIS
jgi:hypothetical protein